MLATRAHARARARCVDPLRNYVYVHTGIIRITPNRRLSPPAARGACSDAARSYSSLVGLGSNVVDYFFKVPAFPKPGTKGFFSDRMRPLTGTVVGGVTLNHLAWARVLGVPSGLLALQGNDESGKLIRAALDEVGVDRSNVLVGDEYTSSVSHIFLDRCAGGQSVTSPILPPRCRASSPAGCALSPPGTGSDPS